MTSGLSSFVLVNLARLQFHDGRRLPSPLGLRLHASVLEVDVSD